MFFKLSRETKYRVFPITFSRSILKRSFINYDFTQNKLTTGEIIIRRIMCISICLDRCARTWVNSYLRKHAYSNTLKILPPKNENFQIKNSDIFHISAQNID